MDLDRRGHRQKTRNVADEQPGLHVDKGRKQRAPTPADADLDKSGIAFMPGSIWNSGAGVLKSTDYGENWSRVGIATDQAVVFGTPKRV
ncbi:MAG: hypothetical protein K2X57_30700 [Xanthobacteraceae bacterium]|nr:hypothetical protein [Xanthobacteraceae bacterium]